MATARKITCKTCGADFTHAKSGSPKYCPKCRPSKNRSRDWARIEARAQQAEAAEAEALLGDATPARPMALAGQRMAVGLSICPDDPAMAALVAGLDLTRKEAEALARTAKEKHADLMEGRTTATARTMQQALTMGALRLLERVHDLGDSQLVNALRSTVQALDQYQGGTQAAYTEVTVVWPGVDEPS